MGITPNGVAYVCKAKLTPYKLNKLIFTGYIYYKKTD